MKDTGPLASVCQQQSAAGKTKEEIIAFLRNQGCSKVESIAVIVRAFGLALSDAKHMVHVSHAWSDVRLRDDDFHQKLEEGFQEQGDDEI